MKNIGGDLGKISLEVKVEVSRFVKLELCAEILTLAVQALRQNDDWQNYF